MKLKFICWRVLGLCSLLILLGSQIAIAANVTFVGTDLDTTDYSATGLNIGGLGYWFANFGTSPAETGVPVDQNAAANLPSWIQLVSDETDPDFSWADDPNASTVESRGGIAGYSTLTLPDGTSGLSGLAIDIKEAGGNNQTNNIIPNMQVLSGVPGDFIFHIVLDNQVVTEESHVQRLRFREEAGSWVVLEPLDLPGSTTRNGIADVHSFRVVDAQPGEILKISLKTQNDGVPIGVGLGGFLISVPEPSSVALIVLGAVGIGWIGWRRK